MMETPQRSFPPSSQLNTNGAANAPGGRRTLLLANSTALPSTSAPGSALSTAAHSDRKLFEQFTFFKEEFIKTALRMDVPIPVDIVEEKSHSLKLFLQQNGPKYIFQIIQSNIISMQLIRPGLSLMVTTLALFKRHLPKHLQFSHDYPPPLWYHERANTPLTLDEIWATQMLPKISDSITVTGCVSILLATHNPIIQELIINLIAGLITISDDAITQMLQVPNILFTQTNKKIPTSEISREKLLQLQLKRITTRLENLSLLQLNAGSPGTAPNDLSRRNSTVEGPMMTPGNPNRMSLRGALDRSNSKLSTSRTSNNNMQAGPASNNDEEELYPEEFGSCFSYILSIALMQKNRHLLLAGCADIIIALARNTPSIMSEFLAKVATSPLPMIDLQKNANNNRGHSLKHLYTNQGHTIEPLHVNPLGAKVIDWAGIRIPLKFLQRYHQIFGTNNNNNQNTNPLMSGMHNLSVVTGASAPSTASGNRGGNDAYSENIKAEYRYTHNRSLLAVCSLLAAAHEIVSYVVQLPGAIEVIKLSASIYSDDELQARPLTTVGANNRNTTENDDRRGSRRPETHSNLPGVIITALNALHLEKQHQNRMKAMMNHPNGGGSTTQSQSNSRKSSNSALTGLHGGNVAATTLKPTTAISLSKFTEKLLPSHKLKPLLQKLGSPSITTSASNFTGLTPNLAAGADPVQQNLSQPIHLSSQMEVKFNATYMKETEQFNLYIQNQNQQKLYQQSPSSPLHQYASKQISEQSRGPLQFQNISKPDPLLASSLKEMDENIRQTLLQPVNDKSKTQSAPYLNQTKSPVMFANDLQPIESNTLTNSESHLDFTGTMNDVMIGRASSAPVSPWNHGMSASRDFFGRLPIQPNVPRRIEPKDVIIVNESMSKIRKKFQLLGENAVRSIQQSGKFLYIVLREISDSSLPISGAEFRNGKNFVTIEERARRVYKPAKSAFFGNEESPNKDQVTGNGDDALNRTDKEKKTLESLDMFDRFSDQGNATTGPSTMNGRTGTFNTAEPTPAWKNANDLYDSNSASDRMDGDYDANYDANSSENRSSNIDDMMSLYRVRLDNIEIDEQELFENFKPIFDFNNPEPDPIEYPALDDPNEKKREYEMYGINNESGFPTNIGGSRISLQVDQTSDLLL